MHTQHTYTYTCKHVHTHTPIHTHKHEYIQVGQTALYFAADRGCEDVVELLLEANADSDLPKKVIHTYQRILFSV